MPDTCDGHRRGPFAAGKPVQPFLNDGGSGINVEHFQRRGDVWMRQIANGAEALPILVGPNRVEHFRFAKMSQQTRARIGIARIGIRGLRIEHAINRFPRRR